MDLQRTEVGSLGVVDGERAGLLDAQGKRVTGIKGIELGMLAEVLHDYDPKTPATQRTQSQTCRRSEYCYARAATIMETSSGYPRRDSSETRAVATEAKRFSGSRSNNRR